MREGFFGLNVALRGLYTAQRALDVVNHNLNNVNTPGFSRQQAIQTASRPMLLADGSGMLGTGSDVTAVNRIRDEYLDFKYWSENIASGEWDTKRVLLEDMEATFNEPSDSGFTQVMNDFYNSLQELAKDPGSGAARSLVRESAVTIAKYFNNTAVRFEKMQSDINYQIKTKVEEVNSAGMQIQQLNRQIYIAELDGSMANDLRDQRTLLVDRLSKIVNIEVNELVTGKLPNGRDDVHFTITISGKSFIDHFNLSKLDIPQRTQNLNSEDISNLYEVKWADGNALNVKGGELRAMLDMRDGNDGLIGTDGVTNSPIFKGVPFYQRKLNEFVRKFAMAFNEGYVDTNGDGIIQAGEDGAGHADGYKLNSAAGDPPSGIRFFTMLGTNNKAVDSMAFLNGAVNPAGITARYNQLTAKNFSVGADIISDYNNISVSGAAGQKGNIDNLNAILMGRHNPHMFSEGSPEDFMKSLVASLGIDSQQAVKMSNTQEAILKQIDNRRLSNSGVSIDEEMANMVKFQHAYNASARMITTMSEIYDTLINKMGV